MLVMFKFKNYASFKDEVVFDMRTVKSYKEHPYNLINCENGDPLLKVSSIYGANASGKSNFVSAYSTFSEIVSHSFQRNDKDSNESFLSSHHYPFYFDDTSFLEDTEFEAIYYSNGNEYKYGFSFDGERINYEWLYKKSLKTKRSTIVFERANNGINFGSTVKAICSKYTDDIDEDVLVLSFFSSLKMKTRIFKEVFSCVEDFLAVSFSKDEIASGLLEIYFKRIFNEKEKVNLLEFLSSIDVGIVDIQVDTNNKDTRIYTYHKGKDNKLHSLFIELESDGTRRAIAIYSLIRMAAKNGRGLIIDEFNNQLHPLLQKYLLDMFYTESETGQLIYTTHDTTMLDNRYMRRDQIWFSEKNDVGESSMYSLADFKVRNDKSFTKDYLAGVYGAIPILKDFSFKEDG